MLFYSCSNGLSQQKQNTSLLLEIHFKQYIQKRIFTFICSWMPILFNERSSSRFTFNFISLPWEKCLRQLARSCIGLHRVHTDTNTKLKITYTLLRSMSLGKVHLVIIEYSLNERGTKVFISIVFTSVSSIRLHQHIFLVENMWGVGDNVPSLSNDCLFKDGLGWSGGWTCPWPSQPFLQAWRSEIYI